MQQNNSSYYIIVWNSYATELDAFVYSTIPTYIIGVFANDKYFNLSSSTSVDISYKKVLGQPVSVNNSTSLGWITFTCGASWSPNTSYFIIDTNISFIYTNTRYDWTYTSDYGNFTISNGTDLPSLIDYNSPTPPSPTPLITSYYTLIFEKLGVLTDYFKNNPYLYAIPLIPIFLLCFYLIKRSLIK